MPEEKLSALAYLKEVGKVSERIDEEQWKYADRALWAAFELLGMQFRVASKAQLDQVRDVAIEILEAFPEGLPEPSVG